MMAAQVDLRFQWSWFSTPDVSQTIHAIELKAMEALFLWISRSFQTQLKPILSGLSFMDTHAGSSTSHA